MSGWLERWRDAYDAELAEFVANLSNLKGPKAFDGYAAAVAADACVKAFTTEGWVPVPALG